MTEFACLNVVICLGERQPEKGWAPSGYFALNTDCCYVCILYSNLTTLRGYGTRDLSKSELLAPFSFTVKLLRTDSFSIQLSGYSYWSHVETFQTS